jgi:hypothetical protein
MKILVTAVLIGLSTFLILGVLFAQDPPFEWPPSYAIEYIQRSPGDPFKNIYMLSGNKARNEMTSLTGFLSTTITIFDLDRQVVISFFPNQVYKESPAGNIKLRHMFDAQGAWEKIATEKINGVEAGKFKITYDKPDRYVYVWLSEDTHEPLKMTNKDGTLVREISRFTSGPVDAHLFAVPEGYKKWDDLPTTGIKQ